MIRAPSPATLEEVRLKLGEILKAKRLLDAPVSVLAVPLTPEEAIGHPQRRDFPIVEGKERVIEARVLGAKGHAFTDSPQDFSGTLQEIVELPLTTNQNRAIFIAALNAALRLLGEIEGTVHCRDEDPERCAEEIAAQALKTWGRVKVGLIGLNPAIAEGLVSVFGASNVRITDLNRQTIGQEKFGVLIWDGREKTGQLIEQSEAVIITGTTLVNGTFDDIFHQIQEKKKKYLIYGVTSSGICHLMGWERICPYGRNE
jgi:uncharacterized protein (DUF4213/DUF364 family)